MKTCYRCDEQLTKDNQSTEHIIINACGGRLKSKSLLCNKCNSFFGEDFDAELAEQTNYFANLLDIKRERGNPQDIDGVYSKSGIPATIQSGWKHNYSQPEIRKEDIDEKSIKLFIRARNPNEFRQIITGLKKRYPTIDVDETINSSERATINEPISFVMKIGVDGTHKSITKTIINFFIYKGGDKSYIKNLIPYLEGKKDNKEILLYLPETKIYLPEVDEVSHLIKIVGNPFDRILYGYIELFNVFNYLIIINNEYDGHEIDYTYSYDLVKNLEIYPKIQLKISRSDLTNYFTKNQSIPVSRLHERLQNFGQVVMKRQEQKQIQNIIREVVSDFLSKNPNEKEIPEYIMKSIEDKIASDLKPQFFHFSDPITEAPPKNKTERSIWIFNKVKKIFS